MSQNLKIRPNKAKLSEYIFEFEKGNLQVPAFQRDFVWTNEKKLELFDSIKKGYPIGSVLLWQPDSSPEINSDSFELIRIGAYEAPKKSSNFFYIIDGFQRLSTLIGCLLHPEKAKNKNIKRNQDEWFKEFNILYNLRDELFEINRKGLDKLEFYQIPIYKLVDGKEFFDFQRKLYQENMEEEISKKFLGKYEEMSLVFQEYEIPRIDIFGGSIYEAIDIFQRLNSTGAPITADWVVSARAYGKDSTFRLGTEIDKLLDINLMPYNFNTLKREIVLQSIVNSFGEVFFDQVSKGGHKKLENLVKQPNFIPTAKNTLGIIPKAVKFLFEDLCVLDSKLIPYNNQLIFITDFFIQVENPSSSQLSELKKWFWVTSYANYFTIFNLTKQRIAYNKFQGFILNGDDPVYYDKPGELFETLSFPSRIDLGSVRAKALALFMLQFQIGENEKTAVEKVDGYKNFKLFYDYGDEIRGANISENTILIIDTIESTIDKFNKDLSQWLFTDDDHSSFFITFEMKILFRKNGSKEEILKMRKALIISKEIEFVEKFNLKYSNS